MKAVARNISLIVFTLLIVSSCSSTNKQVPPSVEQTTTSSEDKTIENVDREQTLRDTLCVADKKYIVHIHRFPDKKAPLLIDVLGNSYYDNSVELTILQQQDTLHHEIITKGKFKHFHSEKEFTSDPLWGMNLSKQKSTPQQLYFTAQVGWGGEGPAFFYILQPNNGEISIERDPSTQEMDYDSKLDI